jgi:hypothetical protein
MAIGASASASASASLSIVDIPAIVRRRARPLPRESSGLVDIGDLCFGEGLERAPITPLLPIASDPEPVRRVDHERRLLWAMTAAAAVAVASMFAVAVAQEPTPVIIRAEAEPAPVMAAADRALPDDPQPIMPRDASRAAMGDVEGEPSTPEDPAIGSEIEAPPPKPVTGSRSAAKRPATKAPAVATPAPRATEPAATKPDETSVECVLDPASCGLGGASPPPVSPPVASPSSLPDKLGTTALRAVLGPAKSAAQACGPRHGAASGTQVQVKLSIAGSTGRVQSATALGDHAGTVLGRCVADALAAPVFPRFAAAQQGVVWPIRM